MIKYLLGDSEREVPWETGTTIFPLVEMVANVYRISISPFSFQNISQMDDSPLNLMWLFHTAFPATGISWFGGQLSNGGAPTH